MDTRALLLALPVLALAGCTADNKVSIEMTRICAPPAAAEVCSFAETCEAQTIGENFVDIDVTDHLWMFVQVDNQRSNNADPSVGRLNTNDAWAQEYLVEFEGADLPDISGRVPGSSFVPAGGSAVISMLPINEPLGAALQLDPTFISTVNPVPVNVVARTRLRGVYGDESEWETGEMEIPIRICRGCTPGFIPCAAGEFEVFCPQPGQGPSSRECVTP